MAGMPSDPVSATQTVSTSHLSADQPPQVVLSRVFCPEGGIILDEQHILDEGAYSIGREPKKKPSIQIPPGDKGISREHATVTVDKTHQSIVLRDKSSKNSTWVNGQRLSQVEERKLFHGDVLRLGDTVLVLSVAPSYAASKDEQGKGRKQDSQQQATTPVNPSSDGESGDPTRILGRSPLIHRLRTQIRCLAQAGQSILLLGGRGTGKERAAAEFHQHSGRSGKLVPLDCGALTSELAASELFGHEKGAFTGAIGEKKGALLSADRGTLFLDEIGNLSLDNQEKLLRALESRSIQAVGSLGKPGTPVDVLLVSATSKDLIADAKSGRFKPDLFDRIAATTLTVPPLRNRREDILLLLQRAVGAGQSKAPKLPSLNTSQVELLLLYAWPGNVRELINVRGDLCAQGFHADLQKQLLKSTYFQSSGPIEAPINSAWTPAENTSASGSASAEPKRPKKQRLTVEELKTLLIKHDGKLLPISKETGWDCHTLRDWVIKYGLQHLRNKTADPE